MLGPLQCPASIDAIDDRHWLARFRHAQTRTERGIAPYHSEESRNRQYDRDIRTARHDAMRQGAPEDGSRVTKPAPGGGAENQADELPCRKI